MADAAILKVFAGHPFLACLGEHCLMRLAVGARPFQAAPGELLSRKGKPSRDFYLICRGHVQVEYTDVTTSHEVAVQTIGPGEAVGWSWLVPPYLSHFDCRALDEVEGVAFDASWLREQCEQNHELGYQLMKNLVCVLARRLEACQHHAGEPAGTRH
jgi:CRP-like cAMP-binding protein